MKERIKISEKSSWGSERMIWFYTKGQLPMVKTSVVITKRPRTEKYGHSLEASCFVK
jgi:hypothetical protein